MRNSVSTQGNQAPRVLHHPGPFDTPAWIAYAAMAICNNNGIETVVLKRGARVPLEASVVMVTDDVPSSALNELQDASPTWTILVKHPTVSDYVPALISAVRNNRHAAIVFTSKDRLDSWLAIAGTDLVHVAIGDPVGFFGSVIGGAE